MLKVMLVKEFLLIWRDKYALAALFILPCIFILIMSIALQDTFGSDRAMLRYAVVDKDHSSLSEQAVSHLAAQAGFQEQKMLNTHLKRQQSLKHNLDIILTIPKGFAGNIAKTTFSKPLLLLEAAANIKQEMLTIYKTNLALIILQLRVAKIKDEFLGGADGQDIENIDISKLVKVRFNSMALDKKPTSTQQSVPSWIVFGMFFIVIPMSTVFINERRQNTLTRMRTMNISIPVLFAGKIIPYMLINQLQVWLMILVGIYVVPFFGAAALTPGNSIIALLMVASGLSIAAIGTALLIAVLTETVEQATTIGGIINILMAAVGGVMVPKFIMPLSMQKIASFSPMSWGLDGFLDIFLRGLGAQDVLAETLYLAGFGAGLLFLAFIILRVKRA